MNERDLMQALERRAEAVDPGSAPLAAMTGRADTLRKRRTAFTVVAAAAAVAVMATTLSVVGLGDDRSSAPEIISPSGSGDTFVDALGVVPAGSGVVSFNDRAAAAKRLGFTASTSDEYASTLLDYAVSGSSTSEPGGIYTPMSSNIEQMAGLPINDLHVLWWVGGDTAPFSAIGIAGFTVYKVTAETDLDAVADDLVEAGLDEGELRGRRHLVADNPGAVTDGGVIGDGYPLDFTNVIIDTDADLLILGSAGEEILEVIDGDRESAANAGTYDALTAGIDDVEAAGLNGEGQCALKRFRVPGLQSPVQSGYLVHGAEPALTARLLFEDDDTAAADLEARTAYFETGSFGQDEAPIETYGTYELTREGSVIDVALDDMTSTTVRDLIAMPGIIGC